MKIRLIDFGAEKLPYRAHYNDAGADVFSPTDYTIAAGGTAVIPLGFGVALPDGMVGFIMVKSSMTALGLDCKLPPIDSGYRGEIHAVVHNTSAHVVHIKRGHKIGQLVIFPVICPEFVKVTGPERGTGAFGSTGKC